MIVVPLPYHRLPIGNTMSSFHRDQGQFVVPSFVLFDEQIRQKILRQMTPKRKNKTTSATLVKLTIHHISQAEPSTILVKSTIPYKCNASIRSLSSLQLANQNQKMATDCIPWK
jgi:hypothetical protein